MKTLVDVIPQRGRCASKTAAKQRRCSNRKKQKGHVVARRVLFPTKQSPLIRKYLLTEICLFSMRQRPLWGLLRHTVPMSFGKNHSQRHQVISRSAGRVGGVLPKEPYRDQAMTAKRAFGKHSPRKDIVLILFFFLAACTPTTQVTSTSEAINVYATSAAQPWLTELYDCAAKQPVTLRLTDLSSDAAIYIRIGEPDVLMTPAYQIDTEELLIVTHRESPLQNLTLEEARDLFAGQGDPSVKVWVYSSGEDIQKMFEQAVMAGRSVTSSASLAVSPGQMSDVLNAESNTVGILPRHWKAGTVRDVYSTGIMPVLVIVKEKPQGTIKEMLSCLQRQP
jgi:hypothetical protein